MKDIGFLPSAFSVSCRRKSSVTTAELQLPRRSVDGKSETQQTKSQLLLWHKLPLCHQVQPQTSPGREAVWLGSTMTPRETDITPT